MKWKSMVALALVYVAFVMNWPWVWGLLFILWTIPSFYTGRTFLVEEVDRTENPVLFWLIIVSWLGMSAYLIGSALLPAGGV